MKFSLINANELDENLRRDWHTIRNASACFDSPYFHPQFTTILARTRDDARIVVCESANKIVGIMPFHKISTFFSRPIGVYLSDYHGLISYPDTEINPSALLNAMGIVYFSFDHVPDSVPAFSSCAWKTSVSPQLNLQGGYDVYRARLAQLQNVKEAGVLKMAAQSSRRIEREIGPLRFEFNSLSTQDFDALLAGKSAQFVRTVGNNSNPFTIDWVRRTLTAIQAEKSEEFSGILSTLHAGDKLIAAHFGIRSKHVLHYWFPWYDTQYAQFSAGTLLLKEVAREAAERGITLIDLGRGEQAYKMRFATGAASLLEGALSRPQLLASTRALYLQQKNKLRESSVGLYLREMKKSLKKNNLD